MSPSRRLVVCAAIGIALVTAGWRFLTFTGFNNDHYIYLSGAQQIVLGEWPVKDFVDPGWPLMYGVSAAARALFGRELWVELLVVAGALAIGAAFTLTAAARLSSSIVVALMVTLLEVGINPRSFGYPKILLYAIAGWAFVTTTRQLTQTRLVLLGVLIVTGFLFRHDHGLYIGVGALAAVVFASWSDGARVLVRRVGMLAATAAVLLLPWAIFVQSSVGLIDYLRPALEFSRNEAEGTVLRSLPRFDWSGTGVSAPINWEVWLFYLFYAVPVVSLGVAWWRARRGTGKWPGELAGVAGIAVMALVMNLGFIRTPLIARLPDASVPPALLGAWLIGLAFDTRPTMARRFAIAAATVLCAVTAAAVAVVADVPGELNRAGVLNRAGAMSERIADLSVRLRKTRPQGSHVPSRNSEALLPFYEYLDRCSSPDDRIVMTGLSPDVFVLANRGFAGGQMAFRPAFYDTPADQQKAIARMRAQSVPFVIVALEEESGFRGALPLVAAYVDEHYEPLAHIPVPSTRGLQIFVERGRRAAGLDAATGWPCFERRTKNEERRTRTSSSFFVLSSSFPWLTTGRLTFPERSASIPPTMRMRCGVVAALMLCGGITVAIAQAPAPPPGTAPPGDVVLGSGNYSPIVQDLDKAIDFYGGLLGLTVPPPQAPGPRAFSSDPALLGMFGMPTAQLRFVTARIPGSTVGVEMVEMKGIDRKPARPKPQDPGGMTLILLVRDIAAAFAPLKKAGVSVVTPGGEPIAFGQNNAARGVIVTDPDGHFVELLQLAQPPETNAPADSNIIGARVRVTVADTERAMKVYRDVLHFQPQIGSFGTTPLLDLMGLKGAEVRQTNAQFPGSALRMEFIELKGVSGTPIKPRLQDPGATRLQVRVKDIDATMVSLKTGGSSVVSSGGTAVTLQGGRKAAIMPDADGLFFVLIGAPPQ